MIRAPAVAGAFYPADSYDLQSQLQTLLARADTAALPVKAMIVPHAGYIYSGAVAAKAYSILQQRNDIENVVLLGPAHYLYVNGVAVPAATHFATPLGEIPINRQAIERISDLPQVSVSDAAHAPEHSLEVQLPFLQMVLEEFQLVPVLVGDANAEEVAEVIGRLWGGEETLLLISSDLSHFHHYEEAQRIDRATGDAILGMSESLAGEQACGCRAINGLMHSVKQRDMRVEELTICNSGDTAGDKDRVVGYGAYALY